MKGSLPHCNGAVSLHWQQNGGNLLSITISDPEKHGSSSSLTNAFVDFRISTRTELPQFCAKDFFVRRRYRDFVWLRQRLCTAFPGAIVPPLPEPDSLLKDDRFSSAFIQRRQAGLQLFLRRVASHSQLARGIDLQTFLEAKVWELQTAKNANSSSWLTSMLSGTEASLSYATHAIQATFRPKDPEEAAVESLRAFSAEYSADVAKVASSHQSSVRTLADTAADLEQLGPAFGLLSQTETELSLPFTQMADTMGSLRELLLQRVQAEHVSGLSALLGFSTGLAASVKEVIANHDASIAEYDLATSLVESKTAERQRHEEQQRAEREGRAPKRGGVLGKLDELMDDPARGAKLDARISEAEIALQAAKSRREEICSTIHAEVRGFHQQTDADFRRGMAEHIQQQLAFEAQQQAHWRKLLEVFTPIETVPHSAGVAASPPRPSPPPSGVRGVERPGPSALDASFAMAEIPPDGAVG